MKNLTKNIFVIAIAIATLASFGLVGVAPVMAIETGDLVKGPNSDAVYYIDGTTKYVFPGAKTYFSWYSDFSNVQLVTVAELDSYADGGMVLYRAGTKLITHPNTAKVYAVEPGGNLRWIPSEEVAAGLFGADWASRVNDVNEVFFPNYTVGSDLASATDVPSGSLVQMEGSDTIYYIDGTSKRPFASMDNLTANNFDADYVLTVSDLSAYTDGASIGGSESSLMDVAQGGSIASDPIVVVGSGLTVAASTMPASASIVVGGNGNGAQALVPMMNLNFTAADDGDVTVTEFKLKKLGLLSDTYILNAYIYDGNTKVASMYSIASGVITFSDASGLFTVTAGSSKSYSIKMDLEDSAGSGATVAFSLESADDITAGSSAISGTFPISGNYMSVASVSDLGMLTVGGTVTAGGGSIDPQDNYELFKASLVSSNQDLEISYLMFSNVGSTSAGDLQELHVMVDGIQYGASIAQENSNGEAMFDLSANPILLTSGQTKEVKLYGNIVSGSSRTYRWGFQNASDIVVMDKMYNINLFPVPNSGTAGVWTVVQAAAADTVASGSITITKASDAPTGNIADGATNVPVSKWSFKAVGEDVKVNTLAYQVNFQESGGTANSSLIIKNLRFYKEVDGVETAIGTSVTTVTDANEDGDTWETAASISLGNALIIPAGDTVYVIAKVDLTDTTIENGDNIAIKLDGSSSADNAQAVTSRTTLDAPGSDTESNDMIVASGSLVSAENSAFADPTIVKGATAQKIASWVITAGAAEGVNISQIVVKDNNGSLNGTATTYAFGDTFANAELWDSSKATQYGQTMSSPSGTIGASNTFSISNLSLNAGESKVIDLYADVLSGSSWTSGDGLEIDSMTGTGVSTSTSVSDSTGGVGQGLTVATAGTLTVAVAASPTNPAASILVSGSTDNVIGAWKLSANTNEPLTISQLILNEVHGDNTPGNTPSVSLYVDNVLVGGPVPLVSASPNKATFTGLDITVPAGNYVNLVAKVSVSNQTNATEGNSVTFRLSTPAAITGAAANNIIARGVTSGTYAILASASTNYDANSHIVYDTLVTVTTSDVDAGAAAGAGKQVLTFDVAVGNKDATLQDMYLERAGTAVVSGTGALTIYASTDLTTALYTMQNVTPSATVVSALSGSTLTVTGHGLAVGNVILVDTTNDASATAQTDALVTVVTDANTFTVTALDGTALTIIDPTADVDGDAIAAGTAAILAESVLYIPFEDGTAVSMPSNSTKSFVVKGDTTGAVQDKTLQLSIPNTSSYYFGWRDSTVGSNINNVFIDSFPVTGGVFTY